MTPAQLRRELLKAFSQAFQKDGFIKGKGSHILLKDVGQATIGQMVFLKVKGPTPRAEFYTTFRHHQVEALASLIMVNHPDKFNPQGFTFHFPSFIFSMTKDDRKRIQNAFPHPYQILDSSSIEGVCTQYQALFRHKIAPFLNENINLETLDNTLNSDLSGEIPYSGQIDIRAVRGLVTRKLIEPESIPELATAYRSLLKNYTEDAKAFFDFFVKELSQTQL